MAAVVAAGNPARAQDWTTAGYDAQRSSWVRASGKISAARLRKPGFELLWQLRLADEASAQRAARPVTPPVLLDLLIGYRGFRALGFAGAPSDRVVAIDTDLGRVEWERRFAPAPPAGGSSACARAMTPNLARPTNAALPALIGGASRGARPARGAVGDPGEGAVTLAQLAARRREAARPAAPSPQSAAPRPAPRPFPVVYVLSSDGMLRTLNVMNGADAESPVPFLPPYANARGLIVVDDVAYVATSRGCGDVPEGLWALDLGTKQVITWRASGGIAGALGPAIAPDGTIYVATGDGRLVALEPRTLKPRRTYRSGGPGFVSSSVVFDYRGNPLIAASGRDARMRLLDGSRTAFIRTPVLAHSLGDALATWADTDDTRWLVAPAGAVVAWRVVQHDSVPALQSGWVSRVVPGPLVAAVVNDVVFVVSRGPQPSSPALLYALDGATGQELWNSGTTIPTGVGAGLSAGGSQVYVATGDGALYAFGFPMEH
jgi:outer membrane protein assembly factor BamB